MDNRRIQFATEIFLTEMRRQQIAQNGLERASVRGLDAYPEKQRSALMASVRRAIQSADAVSDEAFATWKDKKDSAV